MSDHDIEVRESWGATVAIMDEDEADMEHHWWFDVTEKGRWVLLAEVIHYDDDARHYVSDDEMYIHPDVQQHLKTAKGIENVIYRREVL